MNTLSIKVKYQVAIITNPKKVMDFTYERYITAIQNAIMLNKHDIIEKDARFEYQNDKKKTLSYPGYSIMEMFDKENCSPEMHQFLKSSQQALQDIEEQFGLYVLPESSWHSTIANLLSGDKYINNILNTGMNGSFSNYVAKSFMKIPVQENSGAIIKLEGIGFMKTCIVAYYSMPFENHYQQLINFRKSVYSVDTLTQLGIGCTRPFLGHITLAYFVKNLTERETEEINNVIKKLNSSDFQNLFGKMMEFQLRKYKDLTNFVKENHFPTYKI